MEREERERESGKDEGEREGMKGKRKLGTLIIRQRRKVKKKQDARKREKEGCEEGR